MKQSTKVHVWDTKKVSVLDALEASGMQHIYYLVIETKNVHIREIWKFKVIFLVSI